MSRTRRALKAVVTLVALSSPAWAGEWTQPVAVTHDMRPCISYRAKLDGDFLVIQATPEAGWHTFAMDNKQRAEEKLAGKPALAVDAPTQIKLTQGLEAVGPWYQSSPKDFSKPELQFFSWGFTGPALFAAKVRRSGAGPAQISIDGQACTETICKKVDVVISLPLTETKAGSPAGVDLKNLVRVR